MKKYIKYLVVIVLLILFLIFYLIFKKNDLNRSIDNTINLKDKINYSTSITLEINDSYTSSKIQYDSIKSGNIKKINIINYIDSKNQNNIIKYEVGNTTYVYNGKSYEKQEKNKEDFNINYELLKEKIIKIKNVKDNEYIVEMEASDAYNILYSKEVVSKDDIDATVYLKIVVDKDTNFIKKISYEIDNLNNSEYENNMVSYKVDIENNDINNHDEIKLPFEK